MLILWMYVTNLENWRFEMSALPLRLMQSSWMDSDKKDNTGFQAIALAAVLFIKQ